MDFQKERGIIFYAGCFERIKMFKLSKKLAELPPYLFLEIDKAKRKARAQGRDIIDLGVGDPDQPTPKHIIEALYKAAQDPANHQHESGNPDGGPKRMVQNRAQQFVSRGAVHEAHDQDDRDGVPEETRRCGEEGHWHRASPILGSGTDF